MTQCNGADEVCSECLANRTNRPFTDMRADAAWRLTEKLPWDFYKFSPKRPLHCCSTAHSSVHGTFTSLASNARRTLAQQLVLR